MNIIIVGCGKIGQKLVEELSSEEHDITAVDLRPGVIRDLTGKYDVMGVTGNGAVIDVLEEAGVTDADILIAVTGSDEINLLTCLIARKAGGCRTIARVRNPEYSKEISIFKEDLGLAMIINPELTAANEIARILRFPSAIQIDTFAKGRVEILKFRIPEGSILDQLKIVDVGRNLKCDVLICGVERGNDAFIPDGSFELRAGDFVSIVASIKNGQFFFKKIGIKSGSVKDAMIVGGGATGYYLAHKLLQTGIAVKIIDNSAARCDELCRLLPRATVINGDGTDASVLIEEGVENAGAVVALTGIDEENILLSLFAKSRSNENAKVVTKLNRISYDEVISALNLDTIIYPKNITAEYIVRFVRAKNNSVGDIETMHFILDGKAEALEFRVNKACSLTDIPLEKLKLRKNILLACINRNGNIIIPRGHDVIKIGDTVIIVTTNTGIQQISDIVE